MRPSDKLIFINVTRFFPSNNQVVAHFQLDKFENRCEKGILHKKDISSEKKTLENWDKDEMCLHEMKCFSLPKPIQLKVLGVVRKNNNGGIRNF